MGSLDLLPQDVGLVYGDKVYGTIFFLINVWGLKIDPHQYMQWIRDVVGSEWSRCYIYRQDGLYVARSMGKELKNHNGDRGCYDTLCEGFVQYDRRVAVGAPLTNLSSYREPQFQIHLEEQKDMYTGDWWLFLGADNKQVGYWPKSLFSHLSSATGATLLSWAGMAGAMPGQVFPPIGSGHYAEEGTGRSCFFRKVLFKDNIGNFRQMNEHYMFSRLDSRRYSVKYLNYKGDWGWTMFIGGPGGRAG
ncbi:hypothetical protein H6P81_017125 [Aristolochia fimbriata]|uniref:Neprosin PEP catalytic domain-containing protein n=1 Tax=Aristolochia fimbriata TaxID=158543 RepID=A0AAV7E0C4_ARIFI|nr:hypothetical protein H6P81_017125 [Aristolochia fimbriata]